MDPAPDPSVDPDETHPVGPRPGRSTIGLFLVVVLVVLAIDQVTKVLAVERLAGREPIELVPGFLSLTFLRNPGAAFGLGTSMTVLLSLVAVVVCVVVARMAPRLRDRGWTIALALLLAGALGNLSDRLFREPGFLRGHVVDFIDYNGWFVGNVADIALTVAAVLVVWRSWRGVGLDGTRDDTEADA